MQNDFIIRHLLEAVNDPGFLIYESDDSEFARGSNSGVRILKNYIRGIIDAGSRATA